MNDHAAKAERAPQSEVLGKLLHELSDLSLALDNQASALQERLLGRQLPYNAPDGKEPEEGLLLIVASSIERAVAKLVHARNVLADVLRELGVK